MVNPITIREKFPDEKRRECETHAGLWFDRYIGQQKKRGEKLQNGEVESRAQLVCEVAKQPISTTYQAYFTRWQQNLAEIGAKLCEAQVRGRMVVGLGSESVLETSICLHRTYGVPYIPGSALKGLAASYAHQRLDGEWKQGGKYHTVVFGNTDEAGYITFFDALYVPGREDKGQPLSPDIITVHHESYYQDASKAPADSDDPNPVPFLSATGTYLLALAAPDFQQDTPHTRWIDLTFQILEAALEDYGIGAKTSSGYGRMTIQGIENERRETSQQVVTRQPTRPAEHIRPKLPQFRVGQEIRGNVVAFTEELRRKMPSDVKAVLSYESFATTEVVIIVKAEEAQNWQPGNMRNCIFEKEEICDGCTWLICQPRVKKERKK